MLAISAVLAKNGARRPHCTASVVPMIAPTGPIPDEKRARQLLTRPRISRGARRCNSETDATWNAAVQAQNSAMALAPPTTEEAMAPAASATVVPMTTTRTSHCRPIIAEIAGTLIAPRAAPSPPAAAIAP